MNAVAKPMMPAPEKALRGDLRYNEALAPYTTWRVGGPARQLYRPADLVDLALFLKGLPVDEPLLWLGLGSNLLVRDGGFAGTAIMTAGVLGGLAMAEPGRVEAGAGIACNKLARFSVRNGLCGGEFLAGIPGTLGGALAMNAGAWGGETWGLVDTVETIDRRGELRSRNAHEFEVGYRSVNVPEGEWFVSAQLQFADRRQTPEEGQAKIKTWLAERAASQPTGVASAGSVFRNPPGDHAARLIDTCGLKGLRRGGAQVSERHANFFINTGDATAADVEGLIDEVIAIVEREQAIRLQPEVRMVGEWKI
jgi:UDP-N-acetylmuramate dehydrogenase